VKCIVGTVFVEMMSCSNFTLLKGLGLVGILQEVAVSQTGYKTKWKCYQNFTA